MASSETFSLRHGNDNGSPNKRCHEHPTTTTTTTTTRTTTRTRTRTNTPDKMLAMSDGSVSSKESTGSPASSGSSPLSFYPITRLNDGTMMHHDYHYMNNHHHDDAFCSPPRRHVPMDNVYQPQQEQHSPYASGMYDTPQVLSYPDNAPPQPILYTSTCREHAKPLPYHHHSHPPPPPPPHPHPYPPVMAPASSSDSTQHSPFPYAVHHPSFESHGGPFVTYYHPHAPLAYTTPAPWMAVQPNYIYKIEPQDVLCGRGGSTNAHSGNRAFRLLVKRHQNAYLNAKKCDKPAVANKIVQLIRKGGGRFLRKCDATIQGNVVWVDIGDSKAMEKTCQALREGAPEIRRRQSFDVKPVNTTDTQDDENDDVAKKERKGAMDKRETDVKDVHLDARDDLEQASRTTANDTKQLAETKESPVICPSARLMKRSTMTEITMAELTPREREMYLRDFVPPDSTTHGIQRREVICIAGHYEPVAQGENDDDSIMENDDDDDDDDDEWIEDE